MAGTEFLAANRQAAGKAGLKFLPVIALLFFFFSGSEPAAASQLNLPEDSFTFPPVLDGEMVKHDFILFNRGKSSLTILDVKPDCGCTTVSYSRQIPPGKKGKISVMVDTSGFGGEHVVKEIAVRTGSPDNQTFNLVMTGDVKPLADINPSQVSLTGKEGQEIKQVLTIRPLRENRFRILEAKAEKGKDIRFALDEIKAPEGTKYRLTVQNAKQDKGWYMDNIYLKTDSRRSPYLKIRVLGMIRGNP